WGRLTALELSNPRESLTESVFRQIAASLSHSRLVYLGLAHTGATRGHVGTGRVAASAPALTEALASAPSWGPLQALNVWGNGLNGTALARLASCPHLAGLTRLDLSANGLTDADAKVLARCPHLTGLTHLSLTHSGLTNEGLRVLAAAP